MANCNIFQNNIVYSYLKKIFISGYETQATRRQQGISVMGFPDFIYYLLNVLQGYNKDYGSSKAKQYYPT
jgi:hypothetical protein